jgi:hypothetical protein
VIWLSILAGVLGVVALWQGYRLKHRFEGALGSNPELNLEQNLIAYFKRIEEAEAKISSLAAAQAKLAVQAGLAQQKISIVRFNPFGDTGGDQSFVLAVLDAHNSGYVITSIHGREGTRIYIKPIDYGKSKYTLSQEEQKAFEQASKRVPKEA